MDISQMMPLAVQDAIRNGDYSLLFGAGASIGATSSDKRPLPSSDGFAIELITRLRLDISQGTPLPYVWEAAAEKLETESRLRSETTVPRFTNCVPADFHLLIPSFAWRRLFTFNVDDVVQRAYGGVTDRIQELEIVHFDDEYSESAPIEDKCQLVFLHGSESFPNKPLVFGPPAYAATITRQHTWWHVFADTFVTQPFIVVGATLREPDFETYLVQKRRPHQPLLPPSFFVSPRIDDATRALCKRFGLEPIETTAEHFFRQLSELVTTREKLSVRRARGITASSLLGAVRDHAHLATLARQFVMVNEVKSWPKNERPPQHFYEGYEPIWDDIERDLDVQLSVEANLLRKTEGFLEASDSPHGVAILCLEGTAGSGKTTALMRTAAKLAETGVNTLYFVGRERLRTDTLLYLVRALPPKTSLVLTIDDLAEHLNQVRRFIQEYPVSAVRCLLLGSVRPGRKAIVSRALERLAPLVFENTSALGYPEALELAAKLRSAAKLGQLAGQTDADLAKRFVAAKAQGWGGQLLAILLEVVPGGKFEDKIQSEWGALEEETLRRFYGVVCLASACGGPLRSSVAYRAIGNADTGTLSRELFGGVLRGMTSWTNREYVSPRHRVVGEATVRCMTSSELFDIAVRLGNALSPYVSRRTIIDRTPEATMARHLMDADGPVIPRLGHAAMKWFETLERVWGWNSRFWEQRALVSLRHQKFSRARDYAEQAVGIEKHPLPMTTLAVVKLASAEQDMSLNPEQRADLVRESIGLLDEAMRRAAARGFVEIHPYHILFGKAYDVSKKILKKPPPELRRLISDVLPTAERQFGHDQGLVRLIDRLKADGY